MIISIFSTLMFAVSLALLNSFTPLSLGFWILMLALCASMTAGSATFSWFGFMMFLIYIGGMLVMFAYFMAIQPNQQLNIMPSATTVLITILITPLMTSYTATAYNTAHTMTWITSLISSYNTPSLMMLGLVLFLALLTVVKISSTFMGPLRPFTYV